MRFLQRLMVIGVLAALPVALFLLLGDLGRIEEFGAAGPYEEPDPWTCAGPLETMAERCGPSAFIPNWLAFWLPFGTLPVVLAGIGWRERACGRRPSARSFGRAAVLSALALAAATAVIDREAGFPFLFGGPDLWLLVAMGGGPGIVLGIPLAFEAAGVGPGRPGPAAAGP